MEARIRGDWTKNNSHPEASVWAFEYNNVYYPDTDDTAMVLMALRLVQPKDRQSIEAVFGRALPWLSHVFASRFHFFASIILSAAEISSKVGAFHRRTVQPPALAR